VNTTNLRHKGKNRYSDYYLKDFVCRDLARYRRKTFKP